MKMLGIRIKKRMTLLINNFKSDCHFSIFYAFLRIVDEIGDRLYLKKISNIAHKRKDKWILEYLKRQLHEVIVKYKNDAEIGVYEDSTPIWVCWWTGEETAPDLVKQCIHSIKKRAGKHPVIFIDQNSYLSYVSIPKYMLEKVEKGDMGMAHLSDYLRVSLLEKYGGLWLESTIFCSDTIPENCFELPFFTCKSDAMTCRYLSQMRWTTFVLGGWKGNVFYRFLKEAFEKYWELEKVAIDYLFFDYLIEIGRQEIPGILKCMEKVPINNVHRDDLQAAMNNAIAGEMFETVLCEDTVLYKLSWRETYKTETEDGNESIYTYFLKYHI